MPNTVEYATAAPDKSMVESIGKLARGRITFVGLVLKQYKKS